MITNPIKKAIEIAGTQAALARKCHVGQQTISKWLKAGHVPPGKVMAVIKATKGRVTAQELCPMFRKIIKIASKDTGSSITAKP